MFPFMRPPLSVSHSTLFLYSNFFSVFFDVSLYLLFLSVSLVDLGAYMWCMPLSYKTLTCQKLSAIFDVGRHSYSSTFFGVYGFVLCGHNQMVKLFCPCAIGLHSKTLDICCCHHWTEDSMDVGADDEDTDKPSEQSEDDENDSEEVKDLKSEDDENDSEEVKDLKLLLPYISENI
ncbi:hypothetical protein F4604DRAFT_1685496 [Suillus subluteus]|nr:hypothetical protein F4604DRAFT_1685496 [Suillus subluteus]